MALSNAERQRRWRARQLENDPEGFYARSRASDLRRDPEMKRANDQKSYRRHAENRRAAAREYNATHRTEIAEYQREYYKTKRDPIKAKARRDVNNALKLGKLAKQQCEICGDTAEAHHEDYSKPLDVRWLCRMHHRAHHAR